MCFTKSSKVFIAMDLKLTDMIALMHLKNLFTCDSDSRFFMGTKPIQCSLNVIKAIATSGSHLCKKQSEFVLLSQKFAKLKLGSDFSRHYWIPPKTL